MTEWEVTLAISGPIKAEKYRIDLEVTKGRRQPVLTTVKLNNEQHGIRVRVTLPSRTQKGANDSAVYFVGQMLDVLGLRLDLPLYLSLFNAEFRPISANVKRVIKKYEWEEVFELGRNYSRDRSTFSRALGWYRKGTISEDPIDKFIAFWVTIEIVGAKYAQKNAKTKKGVINQICNCLDQLWGAVEKWRVIPDEASFLNDCYYYRVGIAHGTLEVNIETIQQLVDILPKLQTLAHAFLADWESHGILIEQNRNAVDNLPVDLSL